MRIFPTFFLVAAFQCMLIAGTIYNPVTDFSIDPGANPDGVWSYGKLSSGGSFTLLGYFDGSGATKYWENAQGAYPAYYPYMTIDPTGGAFSEDSYSVPAGSLYMTPGPDTNNDWIDLRFTAPATGVYDFVGQFEFLSSGYDDFAYAFRNGTALLNDVHLIGLDQTVPINLTGVSLASGDLMDFAIQAGTFLGDANALQLDVTQEQTGVPEPSTFSFAALSAAYLLIRLRRK